VRGAVNQPRDFIWVRRWGTDSRVGTNAENARFESVEERCCANIVSDLLVGISDHADKELFGQKVRCTPVKMEVDAILVLRGIG